MYYSEKYKITSHDVDMNDNIRPTYLVRYMQETANHQMRDRKPSYYDFFGQGMSFVLVKLAVEIKAQLHQYDEIEVRTWTAGEKGATFFRGFQVIREGEEIARSVTEWVMTGFRDGKIYRASEVDLSNYESGEQPEMKLPRRFHLPDEEEMEDAGSYSVMYSDCDMNLHMNNTNYLNMLWDRIDGIKESEVTSINIRFRTEAPDGSRIDIKKKEVEAGDLGDDNAERAYAFRSFVDGKANVEAMIGIRKTKPSPFADLYK